MKPATFFWLTATLIYALLFALDVQRFVSLRQSLIVPPLLLTVPGLCVWAGYAIHLRLFRPTVFKSRWFATALIVVMSFVLIVPSHAWCTPGLPAASWYVDAPYLHEIDLTFPSQPKESMDLNVGRYVLISRFDAWMHGRTRLPLAAPLEYDDESPIGGNHDEDFIQIQTNALYFYHLSNIDTGKDLGCASVARPVRFASLMTGSLVSRVFGSIGVWMFAHWAVLLSLPFAVALLLPLTTTQNWRRGFPVTPMTPSATG